MLINHRIDIKKYIVEIFFVVLAIIIIQFCNSIYIHLLTIIVFVLFLIIFSGFNFSHPYFWFSSFFFLYTCAYMIIIIISPNDILANGYNKNNATLIIVALTSVILFVGPQIYTYNYSNFACHSKYYLDLMVLKTLLYGFISVLAICVLSLNIQGVTSKVIQWTERNIFWLIATYCSRYITYIIALLLFMEDNSRNLKTPICISILSICAFSLLTGERDALLRLLIILILSLALLGKIKVKQLIIIIPIGVVIMILMNYLKYFFSTGEFNRDFLLNGNLLYSFLYSDFVDCGSNLQVLLNNSYLKGSKGFGILGKDLLSAVLPSSVMNILYGTPENWNMSVWYNDYFYPGATWNRAFSLIGEGYIIGGILGVLVLFSLIGLMIRWMYNKSRKSPYYAAFYIYGAMSIISAFRGEAGTIFSSIIRIPLSLYGFVWILKGIFVRFSHNGY